MGEEDALRTVECLRGRLLAERIASRNAKEEAQLMGNKLIELETMLKEETKSRNRAEKRLKFLMKKLESINISFTSDESKNSSLAEGSSEVSSVSYTAYSSSKESEDKLLKIQSTCTSVDGSQEAMQNAKPDNETLNPDSNKFLDMLDNFEKIGSGFNTFSSLDEDHHEKSIEVELNEKKDFSLKDGYNLRSSLEEKEKNDLDGEENVDNSLALVPIDLPEPTQSRQTIDPAVLDATVRDALDSLRHAREKLQNQMDRRRMIKVG